MLKRYQHCIVNWEVGRSSIVLELPRGILLSASASSHLTVNVMISALYVILWTDQLENVATLIKVHVSDAFIIL